MNWWVMVVLLAVVLVVGVAVLRPYLFPDENQLALKRLNERIRAWAGIQDLQAEVELLKAGEPTLRLRVLYLAGLAVRLEIHEPEELAGEVYTLRPVSEGWLLVHFRPGLSLGLEARFSERALTQLFRGFGHVDLGKLQASWPAENVVRLSGLAGPFSSAEIRFSPILPEGFSLPERIWVADASGQALELRITELKVNKKLELRELLLLDPLPSRWIPIPIAEDGA